MHQVVSLTMRRNGNYLGSRFMTLNAGTLAPGQSEDVTLQFNPLTDLGVTGLAMDAVDHQTLYVSGVSGIFKTTTGGE